MERIYLIFISLVHNMNCVEISNELNGTIEMNCKDSLEINVTHITVEDQEKSICDDSLCVLNDGDDGIIRDRCNGVSSCGIQKSDLNTKCLRENHVPIIMTYTCDVPYRFACNFDDGGCDVPTTSNWTVGSKVSGVNAIVQDHTTKTDYGKFMYVKNKNGVKANFSSELFYQSTLQCLSLWCILKGNQNLNFSIYQNSLELLSHSSLLNDWTKLNITLQLHNFTTYRLHFVAIMEQNQQGVIALDDITVTEGKCEGKNEAICTFEDDGICIFLQRPIERRWYHGAVTANGILKKDHTTNSPNGYFLYVNSDNSDGNSLYINTLSGIYCFSFWYYLNDESCAILIVFNNTGEIVSVLNGTSSTEWRNEAITIRRDGQFQIVLKADFTKPTISLVAIDDASLSKGFCPGTEVKTDCQSSGGDFQIHGCSAVYIDPNSITVNFPNNSKSSDSQCSIDQQDIATKVLQHCRNYTYNELCTVPLAEFVDGNCSVGTERHLKVEYSCQNKTASATPPLDGTTEKIDISGSRTTSDVIRIDMHTNAETSDTKTIGVVIGVTLVTASVVVIAVILYHRKRNLCTRKQTSTSSSNDYIGDQNFALSTINGSASNRSKYTTSTGGSEYHHYHDIVPTINDQHYVEVDISETTIGCAAPINGNRKLEQNKYITLLSDESVSKLKNNNSIGEENSINKMPKKGNESDYDQVHDADEYHTIDQHMVAPNNYNMLDPNETGFHKGTKHLIDQNTKHSAIGDVSFLGQNDTSEHGVRQDIEIPSANYSVLDPAETGFCRANVDKRHQETESPVADSANYGILDPNESGFCRTGNSKEQEKTSIYELAKPKIKNRESDEKDLYSASQEGTYDCSGSTRHKVQDSKEVYSHLVDNVYDTASHGGRSIDNKNDTYDHFTLQKSANER